MNKKIIFVLVFLVLIIAIISVILLYVVNYKPVEISPKTIVVPDDYATIGWAIGNATNGDIIHVKSGTYYENLIINKSLSLVGENSSSTIIIGAGGRGGGYVVNILANDTKVSGFTIESRNESSLAWYADGIHLLGDRCQVTGNNIVNCYSAIFGDGHGSSSIISGNYIMENIFTAVRFWGVVENVTLSGNTIVSNFDSSIVLDGSSHTIAKNIIANSRWGVGLYRGSDNTVFGNNIQNCSLYGISFYQSSNNTVYENHIANNTAGIYFSQRDDAMPMNYTIFYHNNLVNNGQNAVIGVSGSIDSWDNGKEGNYWSDYHGVDANNDGIGDTQYLIDANNQDRYPLMEPYSIP